MAEEILRRIARQLDVCYHCLKEKIPSGFVSFPEMNVIAKTCPRPNECQKHGINGEK